MNKADLIDVLAPVVGRDKAGPAIEALVAAIIRAVADGESVKVTGLGTFEPVHRKSRAGRNPHTGKPVTVPARTAPAFRPGTAFKDAVADPDAPVRGTRKPASKPAKTGS